MKKKFTLIFVVFLAFALKMAAVTSSIDTTKIQRWIGKGENRAALAVKWFDTKGDGKTLVWGYKWPKDSVRSGADMLMTIAKADHQFYLLMRGGTQYGTAFGGMGYDLKSTGDYLITDGTSTTYARNGFVNVSDYDFDSWTSTDSTAHWNAGWMSNGYWSYYTASSVSDDLGYSSVGASGRQLSDGCVDAWVFSPFTGETNDYDANLEYLPATTDYTHGAFVVNEDWFGHRNSTVNFLSSDGTWEYETMSPL